MDELISVIVPVYNGEKYLPVCMKSLMEQTYRALEIILIDDGSKDGSGAAGISVADRALVQSCFVGRLCSAVPGH